MKNVVVVEGRLDAVVRQVCVMTLQPFQQRLSESFVERYRLGAVQNDAEPVHWIWSRRTSSPKSVWISERRWFSSSLLRSILICVLPVSSLFW